MSLAKTLLIAVSLFCSFAMSTNQAAAEDLWYTVQAGSYLNQKDAEAFYNVLSTKLHLPTIAHLRVEYISSYYTVRAGKFKSSKDIIPLLEEIQTIADQPQVIYAYIRPTRIVWPTKNPQKPSSQTKTSTKAPQSPIVEPPATPNPKEKLFYTIQVGSYLKQDAANRLYQILEKTLPIEMRSFLRIEKIGQFFTVRFNKQLKRHDLTLSLHEAKKAVQDPVILHAYIRDTRIVKLYSARQLPQKPPKPAASKIIKDDPQPAPPEQKKPSQNQLQKKVAALAPLPSIKIQKPKEDKPVIIQKSTKPPLSPEEYTKKIMAKYLDTSHRTKDRKAAQKKAASFAPATNCTTSSCHTTLQEIKLAHYPVKHAKCLACHKQLTKQHPNEGQQDFQLVTTGAPLCQQCHLSIIQGEVIHPPAADGSCLECHAPHGSGHPFLLVVPQAKEQDLCMECHDNKITDHRYQHGPVGLGKCTFCHNPHAANQEALLREAPKKLCLNCHTEFKKGLNESPHIHAPVKNQACQSCHAVHGSPFPDLLTADPHDFCFTCHQDVQDKFDKSRTKHAGLYLEKQCSTCHLAHYSTNKFLLVKDEKELCLTCHGNNSPLKSFSPKNIEKEISNKEYVHAPVAQGECTACHDPHGSQFNSLLMGTYPSTFYAPYDPERYNLCFICHDQELLSAKETEDDTSFRNGTHNLHFVHVGIERKGRTCNACHNAHASDGPKLINRTGATFGEWTMSISFNLTETGGSCMPGCHRKMNYDRDTPAINTSKHTTSEKYYIDYKSKTSSDRALPF